MSQLTDASLKVGIYKVTSPSGRVYIGQSWKIKQRLNRYRRKDCKEQPALYRSLLKYGVDTHAFEVLHELPSDVDQAVLDTYEILYWQAYIDCGVKMLNLKEPGLGGRLFQETKDRIGDFFRGRAKTDRQNELNSLAHRGTKNVNFGKTTHDNQKAAVRDKNIRSRQPFRFINPVGEIVYFVGLAEFCRVNKLSVAAMSQVYSGKISNHRGWRSEESLKLKLRLKKTRT